VLCCSCRIIERNREEILPLQIGLTLCQARSATATATALGRRAFVSIRPPLPPNDARHVTDRGAAVERRRLQSYPPPARSAAASLAAFTASESVGSSLVETGSVAESFAGSKYARNAVICPSTDSMTLTPSSETP
jgi:hypothetical protein